MNHMTKHVNMLEREHSDGSSLLESDVVNGDTGMRYDVPDETYEQNSASVMNELRNKDMISSEDVEIGCIQVYHHIAVDDDDDEREYGDGEEPYWDDDERESNNGEEPSWDDNESESGNGEEPYPNGLYKDDDGHRWTYDVYTIKQHWMNMGEEPPPWLDEEEEASDNNEEEEDDDGESSYE
ncbi:hypothetical protein L208DRAFT_1379745 [Tricholoma matsutake]|nr:hypothetical protein L208DRAFT_1379745 [Tricholoma matsutake 945]